MKLKYTITWSISIISFIVWFISIGANNLNLISKYNLTFDYVSNEEFIIGAPMTIGWIKYASCTEGSNTSQNALIFDNIDYINNISVYAITVKILPTGEIPGVHENINFSVKAAICSNPIFAFNAGYELTYELNVSSELIIDNSSWYDWIGTDKVRDRMKNDMSLLQQTLLGTSPQQGAGYGGNFFWGRSNFGGMHIQQTPSCEWDYDDTLGENITIWMGFHILGTKWCQVQSTPNRAQYTLTSGFGLRSLLSIIMLFMFFYNTITINRRWML